MAIEHVEVDQVGEHEGQPPFAHRLRQRTDVTDRMRIAVQFHTLEPHEAAVPQALTGKPVGQPSAAGLGTHIQRYFLEHEMVARQAPYSYVFATGGLAGDNVSAAAATAVWSSSRVRRARRRAPRAAGR